METPKGPSHLLLQLIYVTLFPALAAQKATVSPKVTGYLGHDVILPCQLTQGLISTTVNQVQWALQEEGAETKTAIIVFNQKFGANISDSPLKERVKLDEYSLTIKNVEMGDKGTFTCSISTFPGGAFEGTTILDVQERPLSAEMVPAVVIAVVLLFAIMVAVPVLICIRRRRCPARHRAVIDISGPESDEPGRSVFGRDEDVVYSDVKLKPSTDVSSFFSNKHRDAAHADDVTYSEVLVSHRQPKSDIECAYV